LTPRTDTLQEVANAAVFRVKSVSSFITGVNLIVDRALTARQFLVPIQNRSQVPEAKPAKNVPRLDVSLELFLQEVDENQLSSVHFFGE
jgi:hypothetical protein